MTINVTGTKGFFVAYVGRLVVRLINEKRPTSPAARSSPQEDCRQSPGEAFPASAEAAPDLSSGLAHENGAAADAVLSCFRCRPRNSGPRRIGPPVRRRLVGL